MENELVKSLKTILKLVMILSLLLVILMGGIWYLMENPNGLPAKKEMLGEETGAKVLVKEEQIKDGVHLPTGLIADDGLELVINNCTNCHTARIIIQNRGDSRHWQELIRWMQQTQGLWDLGDNEKTIISYLAKNYAPKRKGRRLPLTDIEWYELEE